MNDVFAPYRRRLFGLAYRMLGSRADADDAVQDAALKWAATDQTAIRDPQAWLITVTTRAAIDIGRRRARERARYLGPWLPDPLDEAASDVPVFAESLRPAFLLMLETLTPAERAAFLLREVFDSDYADIAAALGTSPEAARQHVSRAKRHLAAGRARFAASPEAERSLMARFAAALAAADHAGMLAILSPGAELYNDGGGKVIAARNVITGADRVVRFLIGVAAKARAPLDWETTTANGAPALVRRVGGRIDSIVSIAASETHINAIYVQRNPDKLAAFTRH